MQPGEGWSAGAFRKEVTSVTAESLAACPEVRRHQHFFVKLSRDFIHRRIEFERCALDRWLASVIFSVRSV